MFKQVVRSFFLLLSILLLVSAVSADTPTSSSTPTYQVYNENELELIALTLTADQVATPGEIVDLTVQITTTYDAPSISVQWHLPDGGELLSGDALSQLPATSANQPVSQSRQLRFDQPGIYALGVTATYSPDPAITVSAEGILYFIVQENNATITTKQPTVDPYANVDSMVTMTNQGSDDTSRSPSADPCFNINGNITRRERTPTTGGLVEAARVPVRFAEVEIRESDTFFDDSYGTVYTDASGNYSYQFCDDDGWFDDELEVYVRLHAVLISANGDDIVEVEDSSWIDETWEFDTGQQVGSSDQNNMRFDMSLDTFWSEVFNIADAVWEAQHFWNISGGDTDGDVLFDYQAEVHYEPGYGDTGSYYNGYTFDEITIADTGDLDAWDDSVIIHEWGHMADDKYGCDDNPGGEHFVSSLVSDPELSWGEGYPDYYQSAVRSSLGVVNARNYLDMTTMGGVNINVDLETWDTVSPALRSQLNEFSIAAMLWDFIDPTPSADDNNDRVFFGHPMVQQVYTDPTFESNGDVFDDTCTAFVYLWSWRDMGMPADGAAAAAVTQNIGVVPRFGTAVVATARDANAIDVNPQYAADYRWWDQLTWVVDTSSSMGAGQLDGVKGVINKQIDDLAQKPAGVEFNLHTLTGPVFTGEFYPDRVKPKVDALSADTTYDWGCLIPVSGLQGLSNAAYNKQKGDIWLFTDGYDSQSPTVNATAQKLTQQRLKGSVALFGGCVTAPNPNELNSTERYVGQGASGPQPNGIVPYLLTALQTGGQFLYVNPGQEGEAGDILRAQLEHSAGAGRWSDYVSNTFTYRWDRLTSAEYQWIPAESLGTDLGQLDKNQTYGGAYPKVVTLANPFPFWGGTNNTLSINEDGVILLSPQTSCNPFCIAGFEQYLNILDTDVNWDYIVKPPSRSAESPTEYGPQVHVYQANVGNENEWEIISTQGYAYYGTYPNGYVQYRAYQAQLNTMTGEIRYLYSSVNDEGNSAEIGLQLNGGFFGDPTKINVSGGAQSGMGYKFIPAPPQPTRTYTVSVDALVEGIGFLLTGYSGDFQPLSIQRPDGTMVDCSDTANVICYNLGLVQYVQTDVAGQTGDWFVTVAPGASGEATFSFMAVAASAIHASSVSDHTLTVGVAKSFLLDLGRTTDDSMVTGWFQSPNGRVFGTEFMLYDDGAHGDIRAGDGYFGSDPFSMPETETGYLWVKGTADGIEFKRNDPAIFNFQPLEVDILEPSFTSEVDEAEYLTIMLTNHDDGTHCLQPDIIFPQEWASWSYNWDYDTFYPLCLAGNETQYRTLTVYPAWWEAASQSKTDVIVTFTDVDDASINDSDSTKFIRTRPVATVEIDNQYQHTYIRPNLTDAVTLTIAAFDEQGAPVADFTPIEVTTDLGYLNLVARSTNAFVYTTDGMAQIALTADTTGDATVTATANGVSATTTVHVRDALPSTLELSVSPMTLAVGENSADIVATLRDQWGNPVPNQTVRLGVNGDKALGNVAGTDFLLITTDANGQAMTTFSRDTTITTGGIQEIVAQLPWTDSNGNEYVAHEQRVKMTLEGETAPTAIQITMLKLVSAVWSGWFGIIPLLGVVTWALTRRR